MKTNYIGKSNHELVFQNLDTNGLIKGFDLFNDVELVSGTIALSTGSFGCPWDSGQVGIIAVEKSKVLKDWGRKKWSKKLENQALESLRAEIQEFSQYLSGEVYGFVIEKPSQCGACDHVENEHVDSCWGFIGDYEYCLTEARLNVPEEVKAA